MSKAFLVGGGSNHKDNKQIRFLRMRIADFVRMNAETLKMLSKFGVRTDDFRFIELFMDYEEMRDSGLKTSYIVAMLARRHGISERSVYRVLRRFRVTV